MMLIPLPFITTMLSLVAVGSTLATQPDFARLESLFQTEFLRNPKVIPAIVRASFHDLMNVDPVGRVGGGRGCLFTKTANFTDNKQLSGPMRNLKRLVESEFGVPFPFSHGDIISFAGKVAVETTFNVSVKWRSGRGECVDEEQELGPHGNISSVSGLDPFLKRYGMSVGEMGILLAGAHGIKFTKMVRKGGNVAFTNDQDGSSGKEWIKNTINTIWVYFDAEVGNPAFKGAGLLRLPVDMMFFPTSLAESTSAANNPPPPIDGDAGLALVEQDLVKFAYESDQVFNVEFAKVYSKMLEIGTDPASLAFYSAVSSNAVTEAIQSAAKLELDLPKPLPKPPLSPISQAFARHPPNDLVASSHTAGTGAIRPSCQKVVKRQFSVAAIIQEAVCSLCVIGAGTFAGAMMGRCIGTVVNRVLEEFGSGSANRIVSREEMDAEVQRMYRLVQQPPSADGSSVLALGKVKRFQ